MNAGLEINQSYLLEVNYTNAGSIQGVRLDGINAQVGLPVLAHLRKGPPAMLVKTLRPLLCAAFFGQAGLRPIPTAMFSVLAVCLPLTSAFGQDLTSSPKPQPHMTYITRDTGNFNVNCTPVTQAAEAARAKGE